MSTESFEKWLEANISSLAKMGTGIKSPTTEELMRAAFAAGAASEREWLIRVLESSGALSLNGVRNLAIMLKQKTLPSDLSSPSRPSLRRIS